VLFAVAFSVRAGAALATGAAAPERRFNLDSAGYIDPGRSLLNNGTFDRSMQVREPAFLRTPGYPLMIAAVFRVAGDENLTAVVLVQSAVGAGTVVMAAWMALRLASRRAAVITGAVCCIDPQMVALSGIVLTETLFAALVTGMTLLMLEAAIATRARRAYLCATGAVLAAVAATYVRPALQYFPLVLLLTVGVGWLWPRLRRAVAWRGRVIAVVAVSGVVF
jgi:4-amino-4-deoxy-L-arabinose transferase-like glycosyltransferase